MTPEQFAYWFQGFAELTPHPPTAEQWQSMREHVATVFKKSTPPLAPPLISTVTPEQKKVSDDIEDMIRRYKEEQQKPNTHPSPWSPYHPWPTSPFWCERDSTGRPALIC